MLARNSRRVLKRARPGNSTQFSSSWSHHGRVLVASPTSILGRNVLQTENFSPQWRLPRQECRHFATPPYSGEALDDALAALPKDGRLQFDFFAEPITFLGLRSGDHTTNAMAALDGFLLAVASKGRTCTGGGEEQGLEMKAAHSSAIAWAELLRHAKVWNVPEEGKEEKDEEKGGNEEAEYSEKETDEERKVSSGKEDDTSSGDHTNTRNQEEQKEKMPFNKSAPMLVVTAIAPVLAQTGPGYVKFLDKLLKHGDSLVPGMGPLQMMAMAEAAIRRKDDPALNERERDHIHAFEHMMKYDHETALMAYLKILRKCPGDILALTLAIDVACMLGDKEAALR